MTILQIHNRYQTPGGEDAVVDAERELLEQHGHTVMRYERHNNEIQAFPLHRKAALLWQTSWSSNGYNTWRDLLRQKKPDLAHVHNTLPLISPSIYAALKKAGVPIVQTLHNFRFFCANGLLYRNNAVCESCLSMRPWPALVHKCYRNSRVQSLAVVAMLLAHQRRTYRRLIDAYIVLSPFAREKFIQAGLPENKIHIKPNFFRLRAVHHAGGKGEYALYLGRLSREKGIEILLQAWRRVNFPLKIAGRGPLEPMVRKKLAGPESAHVEYLSSQPADRVAKLLSHARFLVIPSQWYEGFPRTLVEAYAFGVPVLAARLGALQELVQDQKTGLHFAPEDAGDLAAKASWLAAHPDKTSAMGKTARMVYEKEYTPEINYEQLMHIYQKVIKEEP